MMKKYFAVLGLIALLATGCDDEEKKSVPVVIDSPIIGSWGSASSTEYYYFTFNSNGTVGHNIKLTDEDTGDTINATLSGTFSIGGTVSDGKELNITWTNATGDYAGWPLPENDYSIFKIDGSNLVIAGSTGDEEDSTMLGFTNASSRPSNFDNTDQVVVLGPYTPAASAVPRALLKKSRKFSKR
jgi:hypothetical protein